MARIKCGLQGPPANQSISSQVSHVSKPQTLYAMLTLPLNKSSMQTVAEEATVFAVFTQSVTASSPLAICHTIYNHCRVFATNPLIRQKPRANAPLQYANFQRRLSQAVNDAAIFKNSSKGVCFADLYL